MPAGEEHLHPYRAVTAAADPTWAAARLRRACLSVPGNSTSKLARAATVEVDEVIVDLEDSVPADQKTDETRQLVAGAISGSNWQAPTVAVRINAVDSPWFADDIIAIARLTGPRLASLVLPKVEGPADVLRVVSILGQLEADGVAVGHVGIEAQIETALGLVNVEAIAASSPRLAALVFGPGDFAASMGMPMASIGAIDPDYPGDQWLYPRSRIVVAARAFGLAPIDGPYANFRDPDGLRESARRARILGFAGKWVIHPDQIGICRGAFTPSEAELAAAERALETLDLSRQRGAGAAAIGDTMIDEATRRAAEALRRQRPGGEQP